jgi:hypothetical protein
MKRTSESGHSLTSHPSGRTLMVLAGTSDSLHLAQHFEDRA